MKKFYIPIIVPSIEPGIKLNQPCRACGYTGGNTIPLLGDSEALPPTAVRLAYKCGGCDCYLFTVSRRAAR